MSKTWEVDPETRSKLLLLQKSKGNDRCCDCGAPSPQWASPKFGTFICLNCAGTHRGLGVHISFVRSITMDSFKHGETQRMEHGGNEAWQQFFDEHELNVSEGRTFEDSTIKERYDGDVGEEWKARLTAKIEGREYVPGEEKRPDASRSSTPSVAGVRSSDNNGGGRLPPSRSQSPAKAGLPVSKKEMNEVYFAKLGAENASRPADLPPSQGGKFGGFGGGMPSSPPSRGSQQGGAIPGVNDFQNDPMGSLTKGFGWFTSTLGKSAKSVNDSYLQPAAKQFAESELAANARIAAAEASRNLQTGARGAHDTFTRFVEGPSDGRAAPQSATNRGFQPERKDFWDEFSTIGGQHRRNASTSSSGAIGTATMKKPTTATAATSGTSSSLARSSSTKSMGGGKEEKDDWDDNW